MYPALSSRLSTSRLGWGIAQAASPGRGDINAFRNDVPRSFVWTGRGQAYTSPFYSIKVRPPLQILISSKDSRQGQAKKKLRCSSSMCLLSIYVFLIKVIDAYWQSIFGIRMELHHYTCSLICNHIQLSKNKYENKNKYNRGHNMKARRWCHGWPAFPL